MYIRHPVLPMFRRRQASQPTEDECHVSEATIARIWRGRTPRKRADEYEPYLREAGIIPLEEKALAVQLFREDRATESEFVTISYWESVDAMSVFAGDDPTRIHHLPRDEEFLIELPERVQVLRILVNAEGEG
jgi:hypothetical protein